MKPRTLKPHAATRHPLQLFTKKAGQYDCFIRAVCYPQGLRSHFQRVGYLQSGARILEAGCGTGALTLAITEACERRQLRPSVLHAFDLTPAMLDHLRSRLAKRRVSNIDLAPCNVMHLESLPSGWNDYDLIVSASMMEYLDPAELSAALRGLRQRLRSGGRMVLFITRRNWLTRPLIGRWWQSNLYSADELLTAFREAGFTRVDFRRFKGLYWYLNLWGYIVEADV